MGISDRDYMRASPPEPPAPPAKSMAPRPPSTIPRRLRFKFFLWRILRCIIRKPPAPPCEEAGSDTNPSASQKDNQH